MGKGIATGEDIATEGGIALAVVDTGGFLGEADKKPEGTEQDSKLASKTGPGAKQAGRRYRVWGLRGWGVV